MPNVTYISPNEASQLDLQGVEAIGLDFTKGQDFYMQQTNAHVNIEYLEMVHKTMSDQLEKIKDHSDDTLISCVGGNPRPTKVFRRNFTDLRKACGLRLQTLKGTSSKRKAKKDPKPAQADKSFTMNDLPVITSTEDAMPARESPMETVEEAPETEIPFQPAKKVARNVKELMPKAIQTSNRYEALNKAMEWNMKVEDLHEVVVPPITLLSSEAVHEVLEELNHINGEAITARFMGKKVSINLRDWEAYQATIKYLQEKDMQFFSFTPRKFRPFKVVVKGLPKTANLDKIEQDLKKQGFPPKKVSWLVKPKEGFTKTPLVVALDNNEAMKEVMKLKKLHFYAVRIEKLRRNRRKIACYRCQQVGHTSHFCFMKDVCAFCSGHHLSEKCERENKEELSCIRCINRKDAPKHSARDLSCPALKKKEKAIRVKKTPDTRVQANSDTREETAHTSKLIPRSVTYAEAATGRKAEKKTPSLPKEAEGPSEARNGLFEEAGFSSTPRKKAEFLEAHHRLRNAKTDVQRMELLLDAFAILLTFFN